MAEVNAKDLTTKTAPASTDSMLLFGTSTNEGAKITVDNLANNILERLTTKTFANQVGGSSAATILAQLATLNSNFVHTVGAIPNGDYNDYTNPGIYYCSNLFENKPANEYFRLIVLKAGNSVPFQIAINVDFSIIAFRGVNSGTWQNWRYLHPTTS